MISKYVYFSMYVCVDTDIKSPNAIGEKIVGWDIHENELTTKISFDTFFYELLPWGFGVNDINYVYICTFPDTWKTKCVEKMNIDLITHYNCAKNPRKQVIKNYWSTCLINNK